MVCLVAGVGVAAEIDREEPVQITADHLEYQAARELFLGQGHVRIVRGDRSIEADWVAVARGSLRGVASGNVIYRDGGEELHSAFLQFDVESLRGLVYQGRLDMGKGGFRVDADRLVRTDDKQYTVRAGNFTTCRCAEGEREPWRIEAGRADVEIGGYATARNTTLDILGVPVVWLPWVIFPVKTERESGVLFPEFGYRGDAGFEVGLPLFWAARKNVNVIATPMYMTQRGFKQNLEVEYLLGKKSKGEVFAAYGRDQERVDSEFRDLPGDEFRVNRWTVLADHDQYLPRGFRAKTDVRLISDNAYAQDYVELSAYRDDAFLESKMFAFGQFGRDGRLGVVGTAIYTDDLQGPDSRDRDAFVHQIAPSLRAEALSQREAGLGGFVTRFEFDYTYFYNDRLPQNVYASDDVNLVGKDLFLDIGVDALPTRASEPGFDTVSGEDDDVFSEGEPLADRGHRFVVHPRIAYPLRLFDRFEVYPEVGYRQLLYHTHAQDFAEQGHVTARLDLKTRFVGQLGRNKLTHVIEPVLGWSMVSNASRSGDPLFVPAAATPQYRLREFEHDNLLADPSDRVNRRQALSLGVGNRLYLARRLIGEFNIAIDYNFMGKGTRYSVTADDENYSRIVVAGHSQRLYRMSTEFDLTFDPEAGDVEEGLFGLTVVPWSWIVLNASYRYRAPSPAQSFRFAQQLVHDPWDEKTDALSQIQPTGTLFVGPNLRLRYSASYDLVDDRMLRQQGTVEYRSKCECWAIGLDVQEQRNGEIRYLVRYSLLGSGDDRLRSNSFADSGLLSGR